MENPLAVLALVATILDEQKITYVLVGSLASSIHGMSRSTSNIDIVADIKPGQVVPLINSLEENFHVDEHDVREAIDHHQSFNAIHVNSVLQVDIFIAQTDEFSRKQIERRELRQIAPDLDQKVYVASAEDTILAKLRWFNSSGKVSTNQWTDVVGIIGASSSTLDLDYLREWAKKLDLTELLDRAFQEMKDYDHGSSGE